jgi:CDP-diglyceride synthetase
VGRDKYLLIVRGRKDIQQESITLPALTKVKLLVQFTAMSNNNNTRRRRRGRPDDNGDDVSNFNQKQHHNDNNNNNENPSSTSSPTSSLWSDVPRRLLTICVGFPIVVKMLQTPTMAYIFFMGAHILSAWEYTLLEPTASTTTTTTTTTAVERMCFCFISMILAAIPPNTSSSSSSSSSLFLCLLTLTAGMMMIFGSIRYKYHWTVGLLLITIPFRVWCHLAYQDFASTLAVLLVVWNTDTGALLAGRVAYMIYGHTNKERWKVPDWILTISPKKSMEGFVGGILGGIWTAYSWIPYIVEKWGSGNDNDSDLQQKWFTIETSSAFRQLWGIEIEADNDITDDDSTNIKSTLMLLSSGQRRRLIVGLILSVLAIIGDLVESSIKRQSRSKDSGRALPGHGGILDRFDSSLLAVVVYQVMLEYYIV